MIPIARVRTIVVIFTEVATDGLEPMTEREMRNLIIDAAGESYAIEHVMVHTKEEWRDDPRFD